ncbi:MAG TPA: hypothetical protein VNI77_05185 [Nitrososphaera sp.]|nr:hypothetical protein [Nitrososphaera sp.]
MESLRKRVDSGRTSKLKPFGKELQRSLDNARVDDDYAYWVEEDIARRHWRWKGMVFLTTISTTSPSSWSNRKNRAGTK